MNIYYLMERKSEVTKCQEDFGNFLKQTYYKT